MSKLVEAGRVTDIPMEPAESGDWQISRFTVSEQDAKWEGLRAALNPGRNRGVPEGEYTQLRRNGALVMSDTPDEMYDLAGFYYEARGRVLMHGLGLGCALKMALSKPEVEHVDVVEISPDVIRLVGPYFDDDPRVAIHEGDAYTFRFPPGTRWDVVWHDVWDNICGDNDFATLHRRYGGRCDWQESWCRAEAKRW